MPRNIYLVGAQCTGKTTLTNALATHFRTSLPPEKQPRIIKEVARTVLARHKFAAEDITSSPERCLLLQTLILEAQAEAEKAAVQADSRWFISDRSGADPIVYALAYIPNGDQTTGHDGRSLVRTEHWGQLKKRMAESLIVVCEAGMDWLTDDGVRLMPRDRSEWVAFHGLFCDFLDEQKLLYVVLPKEMLSIRERVDFVLSKWIESRGISE